MITSMYTIVGALCVVLEANMNGREMATHFC